MAGGIWYSQNKTRPGAYINFEASDNSIDPNSSRGIVAVGLDLDWGAEDTLIEVAASDLSSGKTLAKVGFTGDSEQAKILNLILKNALLAKVYRLNKGGEKASTTIGDLTVTAKCKGTFGNKIAILIKAENSIFVVQTFADGYEVDTQRVTSIRDLVANDYVEFSGEGDLQATASSKLLEGGTNSTTTPSTAYKAFFDLLKMTRWQVLPIHNYTDTVNPLITSFIREMRDNEGKYVQAVVANYDEADYEGIINNVNGAVIDGVEVSAAEFTAYVAGLTAGATASDSNTGKVIEGATSIVGQLNNDEIVAALKTGKFVLSTNQNGSIKVEQDINSLHNYGDLSYDFTKNRVIRTLDTIGTTIEDIWETTFLGKVSNNDDGRELFKAAISTHLTDLQNRGIIRNFAGSSDIKIAQGEKIDSVVVVMKIKPVDSMEFLYLTVRVAE